MVNEGNDSESENVLMTPLDVALPLNLDEAVSIRSLPVTAPPSQLLLRVSHDVGRDFTSEMM